VLRLYFEVGYSCLMEGWTSPYNKCTCKTILVQQKLDYTLEKETNYLMLCYDIKCNNILEKVKSYTPHLKSRLLDEI
jgi:hypothetical protein